MTEHIRTNHVMWCSDFFTENDDVWMIHGEFNALIHLDLRTGASNYLASIPNLINMKDFLYIRILKYKQNLVLVPYFANYLAVYNLEYNKFVYIQDVKKIYKNAIFYTCHFPPETLYFMAEWQIFSTSLRKEFSLCIRFYYFTI